LLTEENNGCADDKPSFLMDAGKASQNAKKSITEKNSGA
jgi:hypothetical protein